MLQGASLNVVTVLLLTLSLALEEWEQDLKPQESEDVIEEGEAVYDIFSDSSDDEDLILDYDIVYNFILYYSTLSEAPSEYLFG